MPDPFLLVVISSPSGAGKTTLCRRLLEEFPELRFSVSTTTRPRRGTEVDGKDYYFVSHERFREMIGAGDFVEWAEVHGNYYGTALDQIEVSRTTRGGIVFDVDYQGAAAIKRAYDEAVTIFLLPPSMPELERRIRQRATESEEQLRLRLENARREIEHFEEFDFIVVNDDLDDAYDQLRSVVRAARCRPAYRRHAALALIGAERRSGG